MARYTVTTRFTENQFVGFDELDGVVVEATYENLLGTPMLPWMKEHLEKLDAGEEMKTINFTMFREY